MKKVQKPVYIDPDLYKKIVDNDYFAYSSFQDFVRGAFSREVKVQGKTYSGVTDIEDGVTLMKQGIEKLK